MKKKNKQILCLLIIGIVAAVLYVKRDSLKLSFTGTETYLAEDTSYVDITAANRFQSFKVRYTAYNFQALYGWQLVVQYDPQNVRFQAATLPMPNILNTPASYTLGINYLNATTVRIVDDSAMYSQGGYSGSLPMVDVWFELMGPVGTRVLFRFDPANTMFLTVTGGEVMEIPYSYPPDQVVPEFSSLFILLAFMFAVAIVLMKMKHRFFLRES